ncbi:hypothetical protein FB45DRAFT_684607, partial [Roridomyces roridus]
RLPIELSSLIFKKCIAPVSIDARPKASEAPMLLMQICHSWTRIALANPSFWANIHVANASEEFSSLLEIWLDRAQRVPVNISL